MQAAKRRREHRKLREGEKMLRTKLKIEGMMCSMCEAHICDAIRKAVPQAKKVRASHRKGEADFLTESPVDPGLLKAAVDATGYDCLSVSTGEDVRKGLFGRK